MEITIKGNAKEIAGLIRELQSEPQSRRIEEDKRRSACGAFSSAVGAPAVDANGLS